MSVTERVKAQEGGAPAAAPSRKGRGGREVSQSTLRWLPYLLILPAVIFELVIHIFPMLTGIWISFRGLTKFFIRNWAAAPFVGLKNFRVAMDVNGATGRALLQSFAVTCVFTVLVVGLSWLFGMAAAQALNRPFRGRGPLRTVFLIPYALPAYAGIITWKFMFQRDTGVINHILLGLGIAHQGPFWLIGSNAFIAVTIVAIWRMWPFAFLMIMAGMQSIPTELYEAAAVDGATPRQRFANITLPMLRSVNVVLVLVMFLWVFNDFNTPYVLFGNSQPPAGDLISFHVYNASFLNWNFGSGAAMSVLLLLFLLAVTGVYLLLVGRKERRHNHA